MSYLPAVTKKELVVGDRIYGYQEVLEITPYIDNDGDKRIWVLTTGGRYGTKVHSYKLEWDVVMRSPEWSTTDPLLNDGLESSGGDGA